MAPAERSAVRLSIVGCVYQGAPGLKLYHQEITQAARALGLEYEIIVVDDGSTDEGFAELAALHREDPVHVRAVRLSRNFGNHAAYTAGLARARGELIFCCDTDLQDDPSLLPRFFEEMQRTGADAIFGYQ